MLFQFVIVSKENTSTKTDYSFHMKLANLLINFVANFSFNFLLCSWIHFKACVIHSAPHYIIKQ